MSCTAVLVRYRVERKSRGKQDFFLRVFECKRKACRVSEMSKVCACVRGLQKEPQAPVGIAV